MTIYISLHSKYAKKNKPLFFVLVEEHTDNSPSKQIVDYDNLAFKGRKDKIMYSHVLLIIDH